MKVALASISGLAAAVLLYLVIGIIMLSSKEQAKEQDIVALTAMTMTVYCKDGSQYDTAVDSGEELRCDWKQIVFNYKR